MKKLIIALAALTATAGLSQEPANTATDGASAQSATAPEKDPNERICRNIPTSASRLGRVEECHIRAEWEALSRRAGDQPEVRRER